MSIVFHFGRKRNYMHIFIQKFKKVEPYSYIRSSYQGNKHTRDNTKGEK